MLGSELIGSLEAYGKRLMLQDEDSVESDFQPKINMRSQKSKEVIRSSWKNKREGETSSKEKKNLPCSICKKINQLEKDCRFLDKPTTMALT